jgi:lactate dehydrogenase-like 2-hydroxyacid dehydrogenase
LVAEHTMALMLAVAKRMVADDAATRAVDFVFKYRMPLSDGWSSVSISVLAGTPMDVVNPEVWTRREGFS